MVPSTQNNHDKSFSVLYWLKFKVTFGCSKKKKENEAVDLRGREDSSLKVKEAREIWAPICD